jgi:hypothetical protein
MMAQTLIKYAVRCGYPGSPVPTRRQSGDCGFQLPDAIVCHGLVGLAGLGQLGQTSGQLLQVLRELHKQAAPKPWSKWDEMKPGALAASHR